MSFKKQSDHFIGVVNAISNKLRTKADTYMLKKAHLSFLFERELSLMSRGLFARVKNKKYK